MVGVFPEGAHLHLEEAESNFGKPTSLQPRELSECVYCSDPLTHCRSLLFLTMGTPKSIIRKRTNAYRACCADDCTS
jgi:hypothetical protein